MDLLFGYSRKKMNRAVQGKDRVPYEWTPVIEIKNNRDIIWLIKWQLKYNCKIPYELEKCPLCGE